MNDYNKSMMLFLLLIAGMTIGISFISLQVVFADELEDEIEGYISDSTDEMIDRLTEDIDFGKDNFLNTNEQETEELKNAGKEVFDDLIELAFSSKNLSKAGINFLSPFEMNVILVTVISIVIAIFFGLSMMKAIGKHIALMIILGLIVVGIFVFLRINS